LPLSGSGGRAVRISDVIKSGRHIRPRMIEGALAPRAVIVLRASRARRVANSREHNPRFNPDESLPRGVLEGWRDGESSARVARRFARSSRGQHR
jgi:hypothetical protein